MVKFSSAKNFDMCEYDSPVLYTYDHSVSFTNSGGWSGPEALFKNSRNWGFGSLTQVR